MMGTQTKEAHWRINYICDADATSHYDNTAKGSHYFDTELYM